jgi:hypothetical protein
MSADQDARQEIIRRLRLGNLRTLFRYRYGPVFPNDDAAREDLRELLLPISVGANASIKMERAIEVWAPWMAPDEATQLIDDINLTPIYHRKPTASTLGQRLRLTNAERERLRLWTIAAHDMTPEQAAEYRRAKEAARKRRYRQSRGGKPRAEYEAAGINQIKPWLALGISRRTWYYRLKANCTTSSALKLVTTEDRLVQSEQAETQKAIH